jgi:hypothetical protein
MGQVDGRRWKRPALLPIAFAAGLAACTKFTSFILVATLLLLIAWRRDIRTVATTVASFLFFWTLAGQRLSNLPEFVKQSIEISSGYTTAMVNGKPRIELPLACWYVCFR